MPTVATSPSSATHSCVSAYRSLVGSIGFSDGLRNPLTALSSFVKRQLHNACIHALPANSYRKLSSGLRSVRLDVRHRDWSGNCGSERSTGNQSDLRPTLQDLEAFSRDPLAIEFQSHAATTQPRVVRS